MIDSRQPSVLTLLIQSLRISLSSLSLWVPALVLLSPTLVLQLAAPTYLRTRLSPSVWFVVGGSLGLLLMTQIAMPAIFALVHARRTGSATGASLLRNSSAAGLQSFVGLLLGIVPGIWLQARYAFAAMPPAESGSPLAASATPTRPAIGRLMILGTAALVVSAIGQSLVAVLNDALGVVSQTGSIDGRATFELRYGLHVFTSVLAFVCAAGAATMHAAGVSLMRAGLEPTAASRVAHRSAIHARAMQPALPRAVVVASLVALVAGLAAIVYKIQQHIS